MKKQIYTALMTAMAVLPAQLSALDAAAGLRIIRSFEPVPEFSITNANVIEVDPAFFKFAALSARKTAGKSKMNMLALRNLLPEPALITNAGFFNPPDGALIGEFVEDGVRPGGIIYAGKENIDRIFVVRKNGAVDVIDGKEKITDEELAETAYAVAGKSAWPGHSDATNRTAICITGSGKVLLAAVYPVRTLDDLFSYMKYEGCVPEKTIDLDGGGSTQMSYNYGGSSWTLGWERKGNSVPECHMAQDNDDQRCYRPVATFITAEPR
ncbi:MAG: phosphodiester glycosidase family protein [Elusimicrobia bacterium]|nr:phosphodiester glycosidase family protein [Elusimicrobiota bacterium]